MNPSPPASASAHPLEHAQTHTHEGASSGARGTARREAFSPLALSALDRLLFVAAIAAGLWGAVYWALH
jgi:hypothetical protein